MERCWLPKELILFITELIMSQYKPIELKEIKDQKLAFN